VSTAQTIALMTDENTWEIPILDGFSFTQDTTTQEIQVSEAGQTPIRGTQVFNTALEPVNWSFANYMRPRWEGTVGEADAVERIMWEALAAKNTGNTIDTDDDGLATTRGASGVGMSVDFANSNTNTLLSLSLVFRLGDDTWYHLPDTIVDTAELDFDIEGIATITWSGFANSIVALAGSDLTAVQGWQGTDLDAPPTGVNDYVRAPTANACIRNKLTVLEVTDNLATSAGDSSFFTVQQLAITGGSMTISNNVSYLTPENLGQLNQPCGHITGPRSISGNITAYLKTGTGDTADLMAELSSATNSADPQDYLLDMYIGGSSSDVPVIQVNMAHTHLVIPVINIEDVVTIDIGFNPLPYDSNGYTLDADNEIVVTYFPDES